MTSGRGAAILRAVCFWDRLMNPFRTSLLALSVLSLASGCQLFGLDDREFEINLPEILVGPVQFKGSLLRQQHCPPADQLGSMEGELSVPIAQGLATDLLADDQAGIGEYVDRINGVTISKIEYRIGLNTIRKDLEPIGIYFGPFRDDFDPTAIDLEKETSSEPGGYGAAEYGSTRVIEEGSTTDEVFVPVLQNQSGQARVRQYLSSFRFTTLFGTNLTLSPSDCEKLGGDLEIEARISIVLFVEPI